MQHSLTCLTMEPFSEQSIQLAYNVENIRIGIFRQCLKT